MAKVSKLEKALKRMRKFQAKDKQDNAERMELDAEEHQAKLRAMQLEEQKKAENIDKGFREKAKGKKSMYELEDGLDDMGLN
jgi:hypothetical protein